jgi:GGDEF domain-containing protein
MMSRNHNANRAARRVPLTDIEDRRRAQALREAMRQEREAQAPSAAATLPAQLLSRPDVVIRPASSARAAPSAADGERRVIASITMTLIDRRGRSATDLVRAAMEALQNAQSEGITDDLTAEAGAEHFAVERLELSAIIAEGRG